MRSFRLDPASVPELLRSWPIMLTGAAVGSVLAYLGTTYGWARPLVPLLLGIGVGPGLLVGGIKQRYPTACHLWLLSTGMMTALVGVALRMAFPAWQGSRFDLTWLGISFVTISAFVLLNRGKKEVLR